VTAKANFRRGNQKIGSLSIGLDMTHPLMAGIVAALDPKRRGQAMGLNAFSLFTGLGLGSVFFQSLMGWGLSIALAVFGCVQLLLGLLAFKAFRNERAGRTISFGFSLTAAKGGRRSAQAFRDPTTNCLD